MSQTVLDVFLGDVRLANHAFKEKSSSLEKLIAELRRQIASKDIKPLTLAAAWDLTGKPYDKRLPKYFRAISDLCKYWNNPAVEEFEKAEEQYRRDFLRLYRLMFNVEKFEFVLKELSDALGPYPGNSPDTQWLRLSAVLAKYETRCWFPEDILLPMGVLSSDDFRFYVSRGYVLKDYGAGWKHGEFTHRLQWHVIMSVITEKFTRPMTEPWEHSPFELYTSLGSERHGGIWGFLFDRRGDGNKDGFNHPDWLHQWLLENQKMPNLVGRLSRREEKRRREFATNIKRWYDFHGLNCPKIPDNHADFKKFEIEFVTFLQVNFGVAVRDSVYYGLAGLNEAKYKSDKLADPNTLAKKPKNRSAAYAPISFNGRGAVYKVSPGPLLFADQVDFRRIMSRIKLKE